MVRLHPDVVGDVFVGCCGNVAVVLDGVLLRVLLGCCWLVVGVLLEGSGDVVGVVAEVWWGCCWACCWGCCWNVGGMLFGICCGVVEWLWKCCWAVVVWGSCWDVVGVGMFWCVLLGVLVVVAVLVFLRCCGHLFRCSGVLLRMFC